MSSNIESDEFAYLTAVIKRRVSERTNVALGWVAFGCSAFLLIAIVARRTSWVDETGRGSTTLIDSGGWNIVVTLCGAVALVALAAGVLSRRLEVASALVAAFAFAFAAYVAGSYWLALLRGEVLLEGRSALGPEWSVYPSSAPPVFALAALLGAMASLALAVCWWRQPNAAALPRVPFD